MIAYKENNFCTDKEYYIEFLVLKNLSRILKQYKLFNLLKCTIGVDEKPSIYTVFKDVFPSSIMSIALGNPFIKAKSLKDILVIMRGKNSNINLEDDKSIQSHVIYATNLVLHILIERKVKKISLLEEIGEKVFKATCNDLFGEAFEDLTAPPEVDMNIINRIAKDLRRGRRIELNQKEKEQLDKFILFMKNNSFPNPFEDEGFCLSDGCGDEPVEEWSNEDVELSYDDWL